MQCRHQNISTCDGELLCHAGTGIKQLLQHFRVRGCTLDWKMKSPNMQYRPPIVHNLARGPFKSMCDSHMFLQTSMGKHRRRSEQNLLCPSKEFPLRSQWVYVTLRSQCVGKNDAFEHFQHFPIGLKNEIPEHARQAQLPPYCP